MSFLRLNIGGHTRPPSAEEGVTRRVKVARGAMSLSLLVSGTPVPLTYEPGTAMIRPPAVVAHGWGPLGSAIGDDVVRAEHSTVSPADVMSWGAADPHISIGNQQIFEDDANFIAQTKHELILSTYVWDNVDNSRTLLQGLRQLEANRKRDAGPNDAPIQTYLIIDDYSKTLQQLTSLFGSGRFTNQYTSWTEIARQGVAALALDPKFVNVHFVDFTHLGLGSNHAKYTLRDRAAWQVTGANPQFNSGGTQFDLGQIIYGNIAHAAWVDAARTIYSVDRRIQLKEEPWQAEAYFGPQVPMLFVSRSPNPGLVPEFDNPQTAALCSMLRHATEPVELMSPNLNAPPVVSAILAAVQRGESVYILVTKDFNEAKERQPGQGGANDDVIKSMRQRAQAMGHPELLRFKWPSEDGANASYSHAKFARTGSVVLKGSGNLDTESNGYAHEVNVLVDDRDAAESDSTTIFWPKWDLGVEAF